MKSIKQFPFLLILLLSACATPKSYKEYIIDTKYNQPIGGYRKGTLLEIGPPIWYMDYILDNLYEHHAISPMIDRKNQSIYLLGVAGTDTTGRYMTSRGIKIGDPIQKVEKLYGKPAARSFFAGYMAGVALEFPGPFYHNILFVEDTTSHKVTGIIIGDFTHRW